MPTNFLFGVSLTASFLAGMVALFAPCCITFLFPSYLGTIFKRADKVIFYTIVFALGLATIFVPIAVGFKFIISFFDAWHTEVYYLGAGILILMGFVTFMELKLPFSFVRRGSTASNKVGVSSVYTLGVFSGITSSCCAPVLFAVVTLTSLSPTLFQAFFVASAYVLGMVFPLFVLSVFYDKLTKKVAFARHKLYTVFKVLGSGMFIATGIVIAILNYQGRIVMDYTKGDNQPFRLFIFEVAKYFTNPIVDLVSFGLILLIFYWMLNRRRQTTENGKQTAEKQKTENRI